MKAVLAAGILSLLLSVPAFARYYGDYLGQKNGSTVIVKFEDCTDQRVITAHKIPPSILDKFKRAIVTTGGKKYEACWVEYKDQILLLYPDGDKGAFPQSGLFRRA